MKKKVKAKKILTPAKAKKLVKEGIELRKELAKRIAPMKKGPFTPPKKDPLLGKWSELNGQGPKYRKDEKGVVHVSGVVTGRTKPSKSSLMLPIKVTPPKPTLEQLSKIAAITLQTLRRDIERSAQKEYEARKFLEVKRLTEEAKLDNKMIIADITAAEEIKVKP